MSELIPFLKAINLIENADVVRLVGLGDASHYMDGDDIVFFYEDDTEEYSFPIDAKKNVEVKRDGCQLTFIDEEGEDFPLRLYILTPVLS